METPPGYKETGLNEVGFMVEPHGLRVSTFDSIRFDVWSLHDENDNAKYSHIRAIIDRLALMVK
jgi:hypothetical protein